MHTWKILICNKRDKKVSIRRLYSPELIYQSCKIAFSIWASIPPRNKVEYISWWNIFNVPAAFSLVKFPFLLLEKVGNYLLHFSVQQEQSTFQRLFYGTKGIEITGSNPRCKAGTVVSHFTEGNFFCTTFEICGWALSWNRITPFRINCMS